MPCRTRWLAPGLAVLILAACQPETDAPTAPSFATTTFLQSQVSGRIRGPDGTSICNFIAPGSAISVRAVPMVPFLITGPTQTVVCPTDRYSFLVDSGDYRIRVVLPVSAGLPWRWLEPGVIAVGASRDLSKHIRVRNGLPLGGGASLDGAPIAGVPLTLTYGINPVFAAAVGTTGAGGTWEDNLGRSFLPLQANEQYAPAFQCAGLGVSVVLFGPVQPFMFPSEASSADCQMQTSVATQYTNTGSRIAVGSFPGDIGGQSGALLGTAGSGYGVQFPLSGPPVHFPFTATQLFRGGLFVSAGVGNLLTGFDATGELACFVCQDLGLSSSVSFGTDPSGARAIRWTYDDFSSPEGLGLSVVQHSIDNTGPGDYILFRYAITNNSNVRRSFFAGFFGDWDIDGFGGDDEGATTLDGHLMYATNGGDLGTHAGTLVAGNAPVAGHFFFSQFTVPSESVQASAMSGDIQSPSVPCCFDVRYLQSIGPIALAPGQTTVVWIAVVMGDDLNQMVANGNAAAADIASRAATPAPPAGGAETVYSRAMTQARPVAAPVKGNPRIE